MKEKKMKKTETKKKREKTRLRIVTTFVFSALGFFFLLCFELKCIFFLCFVISNVIPDNMIEATFRKVRGT